MCAIAAGMKRRGVDVCVVTYDPHDFYLPLLKDAGVEHRLLSTTNRLTRMLAVRRELRRGNQDVVLAFLRGPSRFSELAALPRRRWGLVVSERLAVPNMHKRRLLSLRHMHLLADYVTANSHVNRLMVEHAVPKLAGRTVTIYNAVDLERFKPPVSPSASRNGIRLTVAASYQAKKNMTGLIEAVALLRRDAQAMEVSVDWYGAVPSDRSAYNDAMRQIDRHDLKQCFRLNSATSDIAAEYQRADAIVLPSFYEGLPNVVCEGMACGRPILMSAVCDAGNLVKEGENGLLFDPASPRSIADALRSFALLTETQRTAMGRKSRKMAETMFDITLITSKYVELLTAAANRERRTFEHWVPQVPETVHSMLR